MLTELIKITYKSANLCTSSSIMNPSYRNHSDSPKLTATTEHPVDLEYLFRLVRRSLTLTVTDRSQVDTLRG